MGERNWSDTYPILSCIWHASMFDLQEHFKRHWDVLYPDSQIICSTGPDRIEKHEIQISLIIDIS